MAFLAPDLARSAGICAWLVLLSGIGGSVAADEAEARPHQVGYRRLELKFTDAAGGAQARQLDVWYPTQEKEQRHDYWGQIGLAAPDAPVAPGEHPLLLFSHGFLGASDQSIFLTESCARAGYIVASMNHTDALLHRREKSLAPPRFTDFANWTDDKYRDRREDLAALLEQLLVWNAAQDSPWRGRIDEDRIGAMGHSLGGYTVLGMAGGWKSWKEPRFKAAVLFSPFAQPLDANGDLGGVGIPVMVQGGTLDLGITPFLPPVYQKLAGPKALLVLKHETHFGWTNLISLGKTTTDCAAQGNAELMVKYTVAFFDHHLLGSDQSQLLQAADARLQSYRCELE